MPKRLNISKKKFHRTQRLPSSIEGQNSHKLVNRMRTIFFKNLTTIHLFAYSCRAYCKNAILLIRGLPPEYPDNQHHQYDSLTLFTIVKRAFSQPLARHALQLQLGQIVQGIHGDNPTKTTLPLKH